MSRIAARMTRTGYALAILASVVLAAAARAQINQTANADDTARFLAGMQVSANSPLIPLAQDPIAKQHAAYFDTAFGNLEQVRLGKIRAWSAENLKSPSPVMFYMFGGPDFLYADAFFPSAETYVLSGLEPVGQIPDLMRMPRWSALQGLQHIQGSLRSVLSVSYFITVDMFRDLNSGPISGTLPILYVFLARSGKVVHDVSLVHLDENGVLQPGAGLQPWMPARGAKISFSANNGPMKTLYYFSTNLGDDRSRNNPLLQFCKSLGRGDSFLKSASYLLHMPNFSQTRNFLLDRSALILQDDSGIPLTYFDPARWQLRAYGRYVTPIFPAYYQTKLDDFYRRTEPSPLDFGVGYRWRPNESNLLLAIRDPNAPETTSSIAQEPAPAPQPQYRPRPKVEEPPFPFFPFFLFGPPP